MNNRDRGLYEKYYVQKIVDCDLLEVNDWVFVLNPRTDPIARDALRYYAMRASNEGYELLAHELFEKAKELDQWDE